MTATTSTMCFYVWSMSLYSNIKKKQKTVASKFMIIFWAKYDSLYIFTSDNISLIPKSESQKEVIKGTHDKGNCSFQFSFWFNIRNMIWYLMHSVHWGGPFKSPVLRVTIVFILSKVYCFFEGLAMEIFFSSEFQSFLTDVWRKIELSFCWV